MAVRRAVGNLGIAIARSGRRIVVAVSGRLDDAAVAMLETQLDDLINGQGNLSIELDLAATDQPASAAPVIRRFDEGLTAKGGELIVRVRSERNGWTIE